MDHPGRITRARQKLQELDLPALLVTNLTNVRYLTGFSGSNGQVLLTPNDAVFLTDGRYAARAATLVEGADIEIYLDRLTDRLAPLLSSSGVTRLGIEAATMTVGERDDLAQRLDGVELVATSDVVEGLRAVKEPEEVDCIRAAVAIADEAYAWLLERLAPGITEQQVALDLEVYMRQHGAEQRSFEPIVGSGGLSAHIHHTPGVRTLEKGDLVILDFGALYRGYCSDMTRTVVLGSATDQQLEIYDLVRRAQQAGIDAVSAGTPCRDVDAAARQVIDAAGHAENFGHGLGHGVGLDIHENPRFNKISESTLQGGEAMTVEPGVYIREWGGVRIEDIVIVTGNGCEVLGSSPKDELIQL